MPGIKRPVTNKAKIKKAQNKIKIKPDPARPDAVKISNDAKQVVFEKAIAMSLEKGRLVNLREAIDEIVIEWKSGLKPDEYRNQ